MAETDRWVAARGRRILCRIYRPRTDQVLPVMVHFHGGGWVQSSIDTHDRLAREYAAAGDVAVVSVDFALSPEAKFPQALEECAAVVRHLAEHGSAWNIDSGRILLGGDSAGGNLALATALLLRDSGRPTVRGILAFYPIYDSAASARPATGPSAQAVMAALEQMSFVWRACVPHEADRLHPLAAPLRADLAGLPPVLMVFAGDGCSAFRRRSVCGKADSGWRVGGNRGFRWVVHRFLRACGTVQKARRADLYPVPG